MGAEFQRLGSLFVEAETEEKADRRRGEPKSSVFQRSRQSKTRHLASDGDGDGSKDMQISAKDRILLRSARKKLLELQVSKEHPVLAAAADRKGNLKLNAGSMAALIGKVIGSFQAEKKTTTLARVQKAFPDMHGDDLKEIYERELGGLLDQKERQAVMTVATAEMLHVLKVPSSSQGKKIKLQDFVNAFLFELSSF
jgi:hypothetical protein